MNKPRKIVLICFSSFGSLMLLLNGLSFPLCYLPSRREVRFFYFVFPLVVFCSMLLAKFYLARIRGGAKGSPSAPALRQDRYYPLSHCALLLVSAPRARWLFLL